MKRLPTVALGVVCAAAVPALAATVAAQGRAPDRAQARTVTVIEHADNDTTTDTGAKGDSVGDLLTFANEIYDENNAEKVGSDTGWCIRTVAGKSWECFWTLTLADGQITVEGPFYDTRDSRLAIIGGTGVYRDAHGTMLLHARADG